MSFSLYPFLFAIYPLFALYARLPAGLEPSFLIRPLLILLGLTFLIRWLYNRKFQDKEQANLLTTITVFYFSSTGYAYRTIESSLLPDAPPSTHLFFVLVGIILILSFFSPLMWQKYLTPSRLRALSSYLNIVALLVIIYPSFTIGTSIYRVINTNKISSEQIFAENIVLEKASDTPLPDIYYIILDGYMREDALQEVYGYDNQAFTQALETRDFYIAEESRSNYLWTMLSLSSSLNMSYLDIMAEELGNDSIYLLPLHELVEHNTVRSSLEKAGYQTVAVSTEFPYTDWQDADNYLYPYKFNLNELERFYLSMTALGAFYDAELPIVNTLRSWLPIPSYGTRRDRLFYALEQLPKLSQLDGPKFVFVHIIAPHPPFVVDKNGTFLEAEDPYFPVDGYGSAGTVDAYQAAYIEQMQYLNKEILSALDLILADHTSPKIIILQGDHGGGSLLKSSIDDTCLFERISVLNAYYFSDGQTENLYPSITPVNSFRVVFNTYLGTDLSLLEDKTFYSNITSYPYDFVDVSNRIGNTCDDFK